MAGQPEPPPGIEEAYDTAVGKLAEQLSQIDALDNKLGVIIAALVAGTGAFLIADFSVLPRAVIGGLLIASLIFAIFGFAVGKYGDAPNPSAYARWATASRPHMKQAFISNILKELDSNAPKLVAKGRLLNLSAGGVAIAAILALLGRIAGLR